MTKLFVAGLPYDMENEELKEIFEAYGPVRSAMIAVDKETKKSRGFGFIEYPDKTHAEKAIEALDGGKLEGRTLVVKPAIEKERKVVRR